MIKGPIDCGVQAQTALRTQTTATETLLRELHDSFNAPMMEHFKSPDALRSGANPFLSGKFLREAIFYCSESAYPFQYRDFAPEKYKRDEEWLLRKMGFAIPDAVRVMGLIKSITEARMLRLPDTDEDAALTANYLQAFTFSRDEIVRASGLAEYLG